MFTKLLNHKDLVGVPILILLNKSENNESTNKQKILEIFNLQNIQNRDWLIQCVSAENGTGLSNALEVLIHYLEKNGRYVDTSAYI